MSRTAVRYPTMLRMVPRHTKSITSIELAEIREGDGFTVTRKQ
jgi:hypothetical protein